MNKVELEIQRLSHIIQFGLDQQNLGLDLEHLTEKLTGQLPMGANALTFSSRKSMINAQIFMKCIQFFFAAIITLLIACVFIWLSWGQLQKHSLDFMFFVIAILAITITVFCSIKFTQYFQIFNAIRQITQIQAAPERRQSNIDEHFLAQQFFTARRQTRFIGMFITLLSGVLLTYILMNPPQNLIKLAFILPLMFMLGIGIILRPISKAENLYLYGTTQLPWKYFPIALKSCTIIGVILCILMLAWFEL